MKNETFCTLFDSFYLSRGLMMIQSLLRHSGPGIRIYVFCFDDPTFEVLNRIPLQQVILIRLSDFETPALLGVKKSRTKGEYCWTATAQTLVHVFETFNESECTYVDADLYFYRPVDTIAEEVLITEHRYSPKYDQTSRSGRFCVQYVHFKRTERAIALLKQWRDQCLEWCFDRHEVGRFGDQMYLDPWPQMGDWVKVSDDIRVGVAPWNIQQYSQANFSPLFYHFHAIKWYSDGWINLGGYDLKLWVRRQVYQSYLDEWMKTSKQLHRESNIPLPQIDFGKLSVIQRFRQYVKRWLFPKDFIKVSPCQE